MHVQSFARHLPLLCSRSVPRVIAGLSLLLLGSTLSSSALWGQSLGTISPAGPSVHAGGTQKFTLNANGRNVSGGFWYVLGDNTGNFDADGTYHSPAAIPSPSTVTIGFYYGGLNAPSTLTVTNPVPVPDYTTVSTITQIATPMAIHGSGFLPSTVVYVQGRAMPTTYYGQDWISTVVTLSAPTSGTIAITLKNPDPGTSSTAINVPAVFPAITAVTPSTLAGGWSTITLTGTGFTASTALLLDGKPLQTTVNSATKVTGYGYLPAWKTGTSTIAVTPQPGSAVSASTSLRIKMPNLPYDIAARFATQAAFGPRPDLVEHIQSVGLLGFLNEQIALPGVTYTPGVLPRYFFMRAAVQGNSLLRLRVSTALQTFITNQAYYTEYQSYASFEKKIEADAFGNFRQLMTDITADARMGEFLNLAGNYMSTDPNIHPNQNFARELMQLFTLGTTLLNDDGSAKLDSSGKPLATFDQSTIIDLSRALTGWGQATPVDPNFTLGQIDYSQPLAAHDEFHDHGAKTLFGNVYLPAGQSIQQDRTAALDAIFNHPNLPPYVASRLIQHMVKSNPTPAYVARVAAVFKNNGKGVRGDLTAVVRAMLLDPEARMGDLIPVSSDGILQDPLLFELFVMNALQQPGMDGQVIYLPGKLGQEWWHANSVFGFYPVNFQIPGTTINSPEYSLFNNLTALHRSQYLYGMVNGGTSGFGQTYMPSSWMFTAFTNVPDLVDGLNHLLYHGQMSAAEQTAITTYCSGIPDKRQAFAQAIFLALNSDSFNVIH